MQKGPPLGHAEFAVLDAVHRGTLRSRQAVLHVRTSRGQPAGPAVLHDALHRCEQAGLLTSRREASGRVYKLTASGRARLRTDRRFRLALGRLLARSRE
jgi:DNA-binding PadR family transcriptional regulator